MSTPTSLVLSTPELLESILTHLPLPSLLSAHLISRTFHATILASPTLQRALYFRADPSIPPQSWTLNPFLRKHFLPFFVTPGVGMPGHDALHMLDWTKDETTKAAFLRAEASWRRMLPVQPPPLDLNLARATQTRGGTTAWAAEPVSFAPGGVTMGFVYDVAESYVGGNASFEKFGLAIRGSEAGLTMTLHLEMVQQCCRRSAGKRTLVSEGAASRHEVGGLTWIKEEEEEEEEEEAEETRSRWGAIWIRRRKVWRSEWYTDEADQREGVGKHEWDEWRRVRAPIGDPMSDVRGG